MAADVKALEFAGLKILSSSFLLLQGPTMMPETRLDDINLKGDESPRKDTLPGTYDEAPRQKRVCGCLSPMV